MRGAIENVGGNTGAAAQGPRHCSGGRGAHTLAATTPRGCPPQGLGTVSEQQQGSPTGCPTLCWGPQPVWWTWRSQQRWLAPGWGRHAWWRRAVAPVCPRAGNRAGGPGWGRGWGGVALGSSLSWDAPQSHTGKAQPHTLSIEGLNLPGLPLKQTPDSLRAPSLQGQQLLFHLGHPEGMLVSPDQQAGSPSALPCSLPRGQAPYPLLQQRPPQGYPLLQLPQLPLVLALRANLDLALVSIEQL